MKKVWKTPIIKVLAVVKTKAGKNKSCTEDTSWNWGHSTYRATDGSCS